jgi:hypothetical protein
MKVLQTFFILEFLFLFPPVSDAEEWAVFDTHSNEAGYNTFIANASGEVKKLSVGGLRGAIWPRGILTFSTGKGTAFFWGNGTSARSSSDVTFKAASRDGGLLAVERREMDDDFKRHTFLSVIPFAGGPVRDLVELDAGQIEDVAWHPSGHGVAYTHRKSKDKGWDRKIYYRAVKGGSKARLLMANARAPMWSQDGRKLAYESERQVWLLDSNGKNPVKVGPGKLTAWAGNSLLYTEYDKEAVGHHIRKVGPDGKAPKLVKTMHATISYSDHGLSPDGKILAWAGSFRESPEPASKKKEAVMLIDIASGSSRLLEIVNGHPSSKPYWTSDSKNVVISGTIKQRHIFFMPVDGSQPKQAGGNVNIFGGLVSTGIIKMKGTAVVKAEKYEVKRGDQLIGTVTKGQELKVTARANGWIGVVWHDKDGKKLSGWLPAAEVDLK